MDAKGFELLMAAKTLDKGGGMPMDAKGFERLMASKILGKGSRGKIEELEGVPPLTFTANGQPLLDYLISGNTVQNGTPTPEAPVGVVGCGERTENLFDKNNYNIIRANAETGQGVLYGVPETAPYAVYIPVTGGETYSFYSQATLSSSCFTMETPAIGVSIVLNGANTFGSVNVRTAPADAKYLVVFLELGSVTQDRVESVLATLTIVKSPTAPDQYVPYGYKLPILSNNTVTNIYLGEAETTRRIRKLVLTGEEGWQRTANKKCYYINLANGCPMDYLKQTITTSICSHYQSQNNTASGSNEVEGGHFCFYNGGGFELYIGETTISSATDFKSYLQQQYANGTPVTIWYVLAEPETAVVNEPLMKIGDYADTVSMEQAGVSITTNKGSTTLDVRTTVKPSNVYIKYKR